MFTARYDLNLRIIQVQYRHCKDEQLQPWTIFSRPCLYRDSLHSFQFLILGRLTIGRTQVQSPASQGSILGRVRLVPPNKSQNITLKPRCSWISMLGIPASRDHLFYCCNISTFLAGHLAVSFVKRCWLLSYLIQWSCPSVVRCNVCGLWKTCCVLCTVFEVILDRFYRHFLSLWNQTGVLH